MGASYHPEEVPLKKGLQEFGILNVLVGINVCF
jgi:hypothetical protein